MGHINLPAHGNKEIEKILTSFPNVRWEVFSKHIKYSFQAGNILFQPVSFENFNQSFVNCEGVLCSAGFETSAEAFMGKKLCVIPMKNQYEQLFKAIFNPKLNTKMKKCLILLISTIILLTSELIGQDSLLLMNKTNVYFELGGAAIFCSGNLERVFPISRYISFSGRIGLGL